MLGRSASRLIIRGSSEIRKSSTLLMSSTRFPKDCRATACYTGSTMNEQEGKDELADETSQVSQTSEVWRPD